MSGQQEEILVSLHQGVLFRIVLIKISKFIYFGIFLCNKWIFGIQQRYLPDANGDWVAVNKDFWDLGDNTKFLGELLEEQLESWSNANLGRSILSGSLECDWCVKMSCVGSKRSVANDCFIDFSFSCSTTTPPPVQLGVVDLDIFLFLILCGGSL